MHVYAQGYPRALVFPLHSYFALLSASLPRELGLRLHLRRKWGRSCGDWVKTLHGFRALFMIYSTDFREKQTLNV